VRHLAAPSSLAQIPPTKFLMGSYIAADAARLGFQIGYHVLIATPRKCALAAARDANEPLTSDTAGNSSRSRRDRRCCEQLRDGRDAGVNLTLSSEVIDSIFDGYSTVAVQTFAQKLADRGSLMDEVTQI
jgi:hypothetical protein